jgi:hypothetical protein
VQFRDHVRDGVARLGRVKLLGEPGQRSDDFAFQVVGGFEETGNSLFADAILQSFQFPRARASLNVVNDDRMIFVTKEDQAWFAQLDSLI